MPVLDEINRQLASEAPAAFAALSALGREAFLPPGIPVQAGEARGSRINATIGQITDGRGGVLAPASLHRTLAGLSLEARQQALLYSPLGGLPALRRRWAERQARAAGRELSPPLVTVGLTHGLSLVADLFAGPGTPVAVAAPFWGNYRQTFELRRGARLLAGATYRDGRFDPEAIPEALAAEPPGRPVLAILNHPSNPGGYSPTSGERRALVAALVAAADRRPLVVVCDDAYAGLVYEEDVPARSLFWDLLEAHPSLVPIKIDGATKEVSFFGGRVGFLTFPFAAGSAAAAALESKVQGLLRATVGSPVAASQRLLLDALEASELDAEMDAIRARLAGRYRTLRRALAAADPALLEPLPCNSGCFALVELPASSGLDADALRRRLLAEEGVGVISIAPRFVRIAFCSVRSADLADLVGALERTVASAARPGAPLG